MFFFIHIVRMLFLICAVHSFVGCRSVCHSEPRYQRKTAAEWSVILCASNNVAKDAASAMLLNVESDSNGALPVLVHLIKDQNSSTRCRAARAIGKLGVKAEKGIGVLRSALGDESPWVRSAAAGALSNIGRSSIVAVPEIGMMLRDKNFSVRLAAAAALANYGADAKSQLPLLKNALQDENEYVRKDVADAITKIEETRVGIGVR